MVSLHFQEVWRRSQWLLLFATKDLGLFIPLIYRVCCVVFLKYRFAFWWSLNDCHSSVPCDQFQTWEPMRCLSHCSCLLRGGKTISQRPHRNSPQALLGWQGASPPLGQGSHLSLAHSFSAWTDQGSASRETLMVIRRADSHSVGHIYT